MFPGRELTRLAGHKALLRRRIVFRRAQCAVAVARVVQPVAWVDHLVEQWRNLTPMVKLAAIPLGLVLQRAVRRRRRALRPLVRWATLALGVLRLVSAAADRARPVVSRTSRLQRASEQKSEVRGQKSEV